MSSIEGYLKITTKDRHGNVLDVYGFEKNIIVDQGISSMWVRATTEDSEEQYVLGSIQLGSDYGDLAKWGIFRPEPPSRGFTGDDQDVTYTVDTLEFDFPSDSVMRVYASVDGKTLMETHYPDDIDYRFSSATMRFENGDVFSFKRFPVRTISREVIVDFDWRFGIVDSSDWCGEGGIGSLNDNLFEGQ